MGGTSQDHRVTPETGELPAWFRDKCRSFRDAGFFQQPEAVASYLTGAQQHLYETYSRFNAQSQAVFVFALGAVAAAGALLGFVSDQDTPRAKAVLLLAAGGALLVFFPLVHFALQNMKERYRTYVAAVVHAAYCHHAAGVPCHPWFDWLESYMREPEVTDERSLCDYWISTPPNSYLPYERAGRLLGSVATAVGLLLIVAGISQWLGL